MDFLPDNRITDPGNTNTSSPLLFTKKKKALHCHRLPPLSTFSPLHYYAWDRNRHKARARSGWALTVYWARGVTSAHYAGQCYIYATKSLEALKTGLAKGFWTGEIRNYQPTIYASSRQWGWKREGRWGVGANSFLFLRSKRLGFDSQLPLDLLSLKSFFHLQREK